MRKTGAIRQGKKPDKCKVHSQTGRFHRADFDPQSGHEQKSRRPAVVGRDLFNRRTGLAIVCPVTSTDRSIPFHVRIPDGLPITGFVMVDQVKSVDYSSRRAKPIATASPELMDQVLAILDACIYE